MRSLVWLLAVFATAVALVILGRVDAGYVLFVYPPYRVEVTMFFFALAAAASFAILYAGVRLLGQILALPATVRAYRARRRRERAHGALAAALQAYYEGRYRRAERQAALAFEIGPAPGLAALLAARAAHQMRNFEDRDRWLERADAAGDERARAGRARLRCGARCAAPRAELGAAPPRHRAPLASGRARRGRLGRGAAPCRAARQARRHRARARRGVQGAGQRRAPRPLSGRCRRLRAALACDQ
ncbi:MAG: hypothetical protein E6H63_18990 [Betaproteobacteria bacterium]|nr:MAG: hypothetical protein E6H63_18990 [Betaproteobacteria bacterium]